MNVKIHSIPGKQIAIWLHTDLKLTKPEFLSACCHRWFWIKGPGLTAMPFNWQKRHTQSPYYDGLRNKKIIFPKFQLDSFHQVVCTGPEVPCELERSEGRSNILCPKSTAKNLSRKTGSEVLLIVQLYSVEGSESCIFPLVKINIFISEFKRIPRHLRN